MPPLWLLSQKDLGREYAKAQRSEAFLARNNTELARRLEGITEAWPHLSAGVSVALAEAGYDKDSTEVRAVGKLQADKTRDEGGGVGGFIKNAWGDYTDNFKGATRTALAGLNAPIEYMEGNFRTAWQAGRVTADDGWAAGNRYLERQGSLGDMAGQTRIGSAFEVADQTGLSVADALNDNPRIPRDKRTESMLQRKASSWLPGVNSLAEKQQVANARRVGLIYDKAHPQGRAITEGRALGTVIGSQPGGVANNIVSGLARLGAQGAGEDDPRDGMTPQERARWERDVTRKSGGIAPAEYVDDSPDAWKARAQKWLEGTPDAIFAGVVDPVGRASGARNRQIANAGRLGGRTTQIDTPTESVMAGRGAQAAEARATMRNIPTPGTRVYRRDRASADLTPSGKPQGLYLNVDREGFVSPFNDVGDTDYRFAVDLDGPRVLKPTQVRLKARGLRPAPTPETELEVDSGVSALRSVLGADEFQSVVTEARKGKASFTSYMSARYPDVQWGRYTDPLDMLSAYGGQLARQRGYRGIYLPSDDPNFTEFVALTDDVLQPATQRRRVFEVGSPTPPRPPITVDGGTRPTIVYENAVDLLTNTKQGEKIVNYVAAEDNYRRLAKVLGPSVHPSTVLRLLAAKDPVSSRQALLEEIGNGFIDTTPNVLRADMASVGLGGNKVASLASATIYRPTGRLRQLAPSEPRIYRSQPAWAVEQYSRLAASMIRDADNSPAQAAINAQRAEIRAAAAARREEGTADEAFEADNAKWEETLDKQQRLDQEFLDDNIKKMAEDWINPDADNTAAYFRLMDVAEQSLIRRGIPKVIAEQITKVMRTPVEEERIFWIDQATGQAHAIPSVTVDGTDLPLAKASIEAEMFTDGIPLWDATQFNKQASKLAAMYESGAFKGAVAVGDGVTALFKFNVLATRGPSYAMRNLAEMQGRLAVSGLSNALTTPLKAMAVRLGDNPDSDASQLIRRRNKRSGRYFTDTAGDDYRERALYEDNASVFMRAQETKGGPYTDERVVHTAGMKRTHRKDGMPWLEANRFQFGKLRASESIRMALDPKITSTDQLKNFFWKSDTRKKMESQHPILTTKEGADRWVDEVILLRIQEQTGGHPDLKDALRTGKLNGIPLVSKDARGNMAHNPAILDELAKYEEFLPDLAAAPGTEMAVSELGSLSKATEAFERGVMTPIFHAVSAVPNNRFVNSPGFRELEWEQAARTIGLGTRETQKELIRLAKKNRAPKELLKQMRKNTEGPPGVLDVKDMRNLNQIKAFDQWMNIVYTSHRKGNWSRSIRMISPFAAAIADMYKFWVPRLYKNPLMLHRVEQALHAGRQDGTFYVDENGEERFLYPASSALMKIAAGAGATLSGATASANLLVTGLQPGFGPFITWSSPLVIPNESKYDWAREFINPYGDPDASGGLFEGLQARHVQRIMTVFGAGTAENKRLLENAQGATLTYLASTGEYGSSEEEQLRLRKDAERNGKALFLVQAVAMANVPISPSAEYQFLDKSGRMVTIAKIAADYRRMQDEDPDNATRNLLGMYGDAVFYAVIGTTEGGQLTTEESYDFARDNPDLVSKYKKVWSFFTDPRSPYSHQEFKRQIRARDKDPRTLEERQIEAQSMAARTMYDQYREQFGPYPSDEEDAYLKTVKAAVKEKFPLWDQTFNVGATEAAVKQAFKAAKDPDLRDTPVAEAIRTYEAARAQVAQYYIDEGVTTSDTGWGKAIRAEEGRDYLRQIGEALVEETPQFKTMWQRVLSNEMMDDQEETP